MKTMLRAVLCAAFVAASFLVYGGDLPDKSVTPGEFNPSVTQSNIQTTVCKSGWTKTIRPKVSYTNKLKHKLLSSGPYKDTRHPSSYYELDHLVPLEIGGAPASEKNLWPEPWNTVNGAHRKDVCETAAKRAICAGRLKLDDARAGFASDWLGFCKLNGFYHAKKM